MPDDQNNAQDPRVNPQQNPYEPVAPVAPQPNQQQSFTNPYSQPEPVSQPQYDQTQPVPPAVPVNPYDNQPQLSPTVFGASPEPVAPAPKKSKKGLLIALILAAVLVVLGGGSALAYNFWYQNPDKVVGDALTNALTAKTVSGDGTIDIKTSDYAVKIALSGKTTTDLAGYMNVKLDYSAGDFSYKLDGEGIFATTGDLYIKVNNVKEFADSISSSSGGMFDFSMYGSIIEKVDGNWVKISNEDLGTFSEETKVAQKCFVDYSNKLKNDAALEKSVTNEITNLYSNNRFIIVSENLGSKDIKGVDSLGYKLNFDGEKSKAFTTGFGETQLGKKMKECDPTINFEDLAKSLTEEGSAEIATELWVSRFGHEITQVNVNGTEEGTTAAVVFNPLFNRSDAIELPKESLTLQELQAEMEKATEAYYSSLLAN